MKNVRIVENDNAPLEIDADKVSTAGYIDVPLPDNNGKIRHISELSGKVVLLDFHIFQTEESTTRIMALRNLSIRKGYFTYSERGRQVYPLSKALVGNILKYGYCVYPDTFAFEDHVESGPVWKWFLEHKESCYARLGANFKGKGPGALRLIADEDLSELKAIFDVSGGTAQTEQIERCSEEKAKEMGMTMEEYLKHTFEYCSPKHFNG